MTTTTLMRLLQLQFCCTIETIFEGVAFELLLFYYGEREYGTTRYRYSCCSNRITRSQVTKGSRMFTNVFLYPPATSLTVAESCCMADRKRCNCIPLLLFAYTWFAR